MTTGSRIFLHLPTSCNWKLLQRYCYIYTNFEIDSLQQLQRLHSYSYSLCSRILTPEVAENWRSNDLDLKSRTESKTPVTCYRSAVHQKPLFYECSTHGDVMASTPADDSAIGWQSSPTPLPWQQMTSIVAQSALMSLAMRKVRLSHNAGG